MNGLELSAWVADHLRSQTPRTVYDGAVPDGAIPDQYLVVWSAEGLEEATRACDAASVQSPTVWVNSVSRDDDPETASREARWGAARARTVLRGVRPEGRWPLQPVPGGSSPARRDESIPETTFVASEQFTLRSSI